MTVDTIVVNKLKLVADRQWSISGMDVVSGSHTSHADPIREQLANTQFIVIPLFSNILFTA